MATHKLAILVDAIGAEKAAKNLKGVDAAVSKIGGHAGKGLRTFGSNLKGALTTPLGLLGITGGLFTLEHVLSDTIGKAQEFGGEINRLSKLAGLSTDVTAGMSLAFTHYGIDAEKAVKITALLEKNVGNLTATKKKSRAFEKLYGLSLVDSNGKVKDANQLLLDSADFFNNKSIPATTKAAALAKLYGRSWADLIPLLSAGKAGLAGIEAEAKKDGLGSLAKAAAENKTAMRDWNTQLDLLEITIGAKLLPKITDLAKTATAFVGQHSDEIVGFFEDASKFAGEMGGAIHDYVLPAFSMIGDAWGKVPADLKKLLIAGFAVNKLSGGALGEIVSELGKGLIKGVLGITAGVVNVNGGVVNGGGVPGAGGGGFNPAGGGGGGIGSAAGAVLPIAGALGIGVTMNGISSTVSNSLASAFGASGTPLATTLAGVMGQLSPLQTIATTITTLDTIPGKLGDVGSELGRIADFINGNNPKPTPGLTGGAPGRGGPATGSQMGGWAANRQAWTDTGKKIGDLEHNAVTAIDGSKAAVVQSQDATKNAVTVGAQGIAHDTLQGASTVTTQSIGNTSRLAGAIAANRPIVTTIVKVNVSASSVSKSVTVQERTGSGSGSAGSNDKTGNGWGGK